MDSSADGNEADVYPTYIRAVFTNDEPRVAGEIFRTDHPENNYESSVIVPLSSRLRDSEDYPKLFEFFRKWVSQRVTFK